MHPFPNFSLRFSLSNKSFAHPGLISESSVLTRFFPLAPATFWPGVTRVRSIPSHFLDFLTVQNLELFEI